MGFWGISALTCSQLWWRTIKNYSLDSQEFSFGKSYIATQLLQLLCNPFYANALFYTPWKHQKTFGIEMQHYDFNSSFNTSEVVVISIEFYYSGVLSQSLYFALAKNTFFREK